MAPFSWEKETPQNPGRFSNEYPHPPKARNGCKFIPAVDINDGKGAIPSGFGRNGTPTLIVQHELQRSRFDNKIESTSWREPGMSKDFSLEP